MWFAQRRSLAVLQVCGDAAVLAWCVLWIVLGSWMTRLVGALAEPVRSIAATGAQEQSTVLRVQQDVTGLPLVGDRIAGAFGTLAGPGAEVNVAGLQLADRIELVAVLAGVVVAVAPALALLLPWLVSRIAFARRARAVAALSARSDADDLLALRALARRPVGALTAVHSDPAGAWRRGDAGVVRSLADLELTAAGLRARSR